MPVYEFRCADCATPFERLLAASAPRPTCPSCGSADVRRVVSMIAGLVGGHRASAEGVTAASGTASGGCACGGACACRR